MTVTISNDDKEINDINKENEVFISELMNKGSFMINWFEGAVLPINHPHYYDGRIIVIVRRVFSNIYGKIQFDKEEYQVSDEIIERLYKYVESNIDKLVRLSLNQNTEMYEGVSDSLSIKYKSIYIDISEINASSEEEKKEIANIKHNLKSILTSSLVTHKKLTEKINIEETINEVFGTSTPDKNSLLIRLVNEINNMPFNVETTIAELMQLKNNEVALVDPLTQGEIFNALKCICAKLNIKIEINRDEFSGLAYHYKFKKSLVSDTIKKITIPSGIKDIDNTVKILVDKIKELPNNTEISISQLLNSDIENYDMQELFEINKKVLSTCKENGITLNFDKYKDEIVGLPYNIPFVKE